MVELTCLNRLLINGLPLWIEESVIQIDRRLSNEVITEQQVVIIGLNDQRWCTREAHTEIVSNIELWIRLVILIVVTIVDNSVTTRHNQIWVTRRANISGGKLVAIENVQVNDCISLLLEQLFNHATEGNGLQEVSQFGHLEAHLLAVILEVSLCFGTLNALKIEL